MPFAHGAVFARRPSRRGMTLIEMIVSMAIFLMAMVALGNLLHMGAQRAVEAETQNVAMVKCQSKLSEAMIGSIPLSAQTEMPFEEDNNWVWSMECDEQSFANLYNVKVTVSRSGGDPNDKTQVSLSQMVMDPSYRGVNNGGSVSNSIVALTASTTASTASTPTPSTSGTNNSASKAKTATSTNNTKAKATTSGNTAGKTAGNTGGNNATAGSNTGAGASAGANKTGGNTNTGGNKTAGGGKGG
jgi:general secretion pathway protein I